MEITGHSINITENVIKDLLAIELYMVIVKLPAYTDYSSDGLRYDRVVNVMSLKKYQKLRTYLHFVDNTKVDDDRYFKVRPVSHSKKNCHAIKNEKRQAIDEMMVPHKGIKAGNRKQYIKSKPHKWGFKIFVWAGISGDFIVYGGSDTFCQHSFSPEEELLGLGDKVVAVYASQYQSHI